MPTYLCVLAALPDGEAAELAALSPGLAAVKYAAQCDEHCPAGFSERLSVRVSADNGQTWFRYTVTARVDRVAIREG